MRSFGLTTALPIKSVVNTAHSALTVAIILRLTTMVPGFGYRWAYTWYVARRMSL